MEEFKKPNNSKDGELQPYNPENGQYEENEQSKNDLDDIKSIGNFYARKLGGLKGDFPLKFPNIEYPVEYLHYYFNNEINWNDVDVPDGKMNFLIDVNHPKQRYLIFRKLLGYNETNVHELKDQILKNASNYEVFLTKGFDKHGFRVKIFMPIKFIDSNKQLIIKTCWVIDKNKKPRFVTAWYDNKLERDFKDEI